MTLAHLLALVTVFTSGPPTRAANPQACYSQRVVLVMGLRGVHAHVYPGKGCDVVHRRRGADDR